MGDLVRLDVSGLVPPVVSELGRKAERKFVEFFTAHLRNDHTRRAYAHAAAQLSEWLAISGMSLAELEPPEAAAYIEDPRGRGEGADDDQSAAVRVVEPVRLPREQRCARLESVQGGAGASGVHARGANSCPRARDGAGVA